MINCVPFLWHNVQISGSIEGLSYCALLLLSNACLRPSYSRGPQTNAVTVKP